MISMLMYSNTLNQKEILHVLKMDNRTNKFFAYIKERLMSGYTKTKQIKFGDNAYEMSKSEIVKLSQDEKPMNCMNILELICLLCSN